MMKTWCSEVNLNLESLFSYNFLNEIFVSYFIYNFGQKIWYKKQRQINKINYFKFVLYYEIIRIVYFCVKTEIPILLHFMEGLYQKAWKKPKFEKHAFGFMVAMATTMT